MTGENKPEDRGRAADEASEEASEGNAVSNGDLEGVVGGIAPSHMGPSSDITLTTQPWGDPI